MVITRGFEGEAFFSIRVFAEKMIATDILKIYFKEFGEEEGEVA